MAIHKNVSSMVQEALIEKYMVAKYCIFYRKDFDLWQSHGCFGYPAAVLLLSIIDTIGSFVIEGGSDKHFQILTHKDYYNFDLTNEQINVIYRKYRNLLTHNSAMPLNTILDIGERKAIIFETISDKTYLYLLPLLGKTKEVLEKFLPNSKAIISSSKIHKNILKMK